MVNRFTEAIKDKNLSRLRELTTDDLVLLNPQGDPIVGRQAVEAFCTRIFGRFDIHSHTDFAVKTSCERTIASVFAYPYITLTAIEGGSAVEMRVSVIGVLRYENGDWRVACILSLVNWHGAGV